MSPKTFVPALLLALLFSMGALLSCQNAVTASNETTPSPSYQVIYHGEGSDSGTVPVDKATYRSGETATALANTGSLVKAGFVFGGWNTKADGSGTPLAVATQWKMGAATVHLYAQWTPDHYGVAYNANGATSGSVPIDVTSYQLGSSAKILGNTGNLSKSGFSFDGWNTKADGSGTTWSPGSTLSLGFSSVVLYAHWKGLDLTVSYDANGAESGSIPIDVANYHSGDTFVVANNSGLLARSGYTWDGWNTMADGKGTVQVPGTSVTLGGSSVVLYSQWAVQSFAISFDANQGSGSMAALTAAFGTGLSLPTVGFVRDGYTFAGWNSRADGTADSHADGSRLTVPAKNLTLYAQWTAKTGILAFQGNGGLGSMDSLSLGTGQGVLLPTHGFSYPGHLFTSWNTKADGSGASYSEAGMFTMGPSSTVLYAQWSLQSYLVSYSTGAGSGSVPASANYSFGSSLTLPTGSGLSRTGYDFVGWSDGSTTYAGGASYSVSGAVNLTAQWAVHLYTVTYGAAGGTGIPPSTVSQAYGTNIVLDSGLTLSRTGYLFAGWSDGTTTLAAGSVQTLTRNLSLTAVWQIQTYFLVYDKGAASGNVPAPAGHLYGATFALFSGGGLAWAGHTFGGWTDGTKTYSGGSNFTILEPTTLTAVWTLDRDTITYSAGDGSGTPPANQTVDYGTSIVLAAGTGLSKVGTTFGGWSDGMTTQAGGTTYLVTRNVTLTAVWNPISSTITYLPGLGIGTVPGSQTATYGTLVQVGTGGSLSRTGYNLVGWTDGTTTYYPGQQVSAPASNLTLSPVWQAKGEFSTYSVAGWTGALANGSVTISPPLLGWLATDWSSVTPNFTFWGTKVQVNGITQTSGVSRVDLRNSVMYTITDADGGTHTFGIVPVPSFTTKSISDGLGSPNVTGVALSGSTLWAATSSSPSGTGGGVSRSDDGGATWITTSLGGNVLRGVTVSGTAVVVGGLDGAYLSDSGGPWNKIFNQGTRQGVRSGGVLYLATDSSGLMISTDGGATWNAKTKSNGLGSNSVASVVVSETTIVAATGPSVSATEGGVSISHDGGATWFNSTTLNGLGSNNVKAVAIDGSTLYAATARDWTNLNGGLSISTDGGQTWVNKTTADGLASNNVSSVTVSGGRAFASSTHYGPYTNDGGLAVSSDGGATWQTFTSGLPSTAVSWVAVSTDTVLLATDAGLAVSR